MIVYSYFVSFVIEHMHDTTVRTFGNRVYQSETPICDSETISKMATIIANDVLSTVPDEDKDNYMFIVLNFQYLKSEEVEI